MAFRLHNRFRDDRGFTLVELLVVILIIGMLAAIALPAFLNQRIKGQDAEAKTAVRNARIALETYHTDRQTYDTDAATLIDLEPSLADAPGLTASGTDETFTVSVDSRPPTAAATFTIELDATGDVHRTCTNAGKGGCRATPDSNGNGW